MTTTHTKTRKNYGNVLEGGRNVSDVGPINIEEVEPTLRYISHIVGFNVLDNTLGSTGKKEWSGDIDIVIEDKQTLENIEDRCKKNFGTDAVKNLSGKGISVKIPIQNYKQRDKKYDSIRTQYVQVDFILGEKKWAQLRFYSPSDKESDSKGMHRNLAISALAHCTDLAESDEKDSYYRPTETTRWKWSPTLGLIKIMRKSQWSTVVHRWKKEQYDVTLTDGKKDISDITKILFGTVLSEKDIGSVEKIVENVNKYRQDDKELIFKRIAKNFVETNTHKGYKFPREVEKHIEWIIKEYQETR